MMTKRITSVASVAALAGALALTGCVSDGDTGSDGGASVPADTGQGGPDTGTSPDPGDTGQGGPGDEGGSSEGVSKDEAGRIATDKYGGSVKEIEDDDYKDIPAWEVEIENSDEGRIEVKVDKSTGEILDMEHD